MSLRGLLEEGVKGDDKSYVNNAEIVQWAKYKHAYTLRFQFYSSHHLLKELRITKNQFKDSLDLSHCNTIPFYLMI